MLTELQQKLESVMGDLEGVCISGVFPPARVLIVWTSAAAFILCHGYASLPTPAMRDTARFCLSPFPPATGPRDALTPDTIRLLYALDYATNQSCSASCHTLDAMNGAPLF